MELQIDLIEFHNCQKITKCFDGDMCPYIREFGFYQGPNPVLCVTSSLVQLGPFILGFTSSID
jgi:hypothetical protein